MVDRVRITVLVDDSENPNKPGLLNRHGLAVLVQAKTGARQVSVLMDTGPSDAIVQNARRLGVSWDDIDAIVLSHGHYDHTGGLLHVLREIHRQVPVVAHPRAFYPKFSTRPKLRFIGTAFAPSEVSAAGGVPVLIRNSLTIAEGVFTTGEIERTESSRETEGFWTVDNGEFVRDGIPDDQALLADVNGKGIAVITGCCHSGVVNTLRHVGNMTGRDRLHAVLGGLHLRDADDGMIRASVQELLGMDIELLGPCHCTGSRAISQMMETLGERCRPLKVGDSIQL